MSCQLSTTAQFGDIKAITEFLYPHWNEAPEDEKSSDYSEWSTRWDSWTIDGDQTEAGSSLPPNKAELSWLQDALISFSPTADHIAIAHEDKVIFFGPKRDKQEESGIKIKFQPLFQKSICEEEKETITAIMCLPLASQKRSMAGGPDWNCVIIGFNTGFVRFYTESGISLLSQLLHEEPVLKLKCRTYEQMDELSILYPKALVCIDGLSLYHSLIACRNQVARAQASGKEVLQPPPMVYKKWGLQEQEKIIDNISIGTHAPSAFDHLQTSCMLGGFCSVTKSTLPATSYHMVLGSGPFIGFYQAFEGSSRPLFSDIATAVVSKLKSTIVSAATGWFSLGGKNADDSQDKHKPKIEQTTHLPIRCGLPDLHRQGDAISLSPNNTLAVTTDNFGRVILIDVKRRIAIRMWKGYRDAQCGWLEAHEEPVAELEPSDHEFNKPLRSALFLVIYAPRRGILEIWLTQQGPRVAAFNVSKWARLLCPGYKLLGDTNSTWQTYQCCLIEPSGILRIITAPFHLALSYTNSSRAHDLQLFRRFKTLLKEKATKNEIIAVLQDMRSSSVKKQAVERLVIYKESTTQLLSSCLSVILDKADSKEDGALDSENKFLIQYCNFYKKLLVVYSAIEKLHLDMKNNPEPLQADVQTLAEILKMDESDVQAMMDNLNKFRIITDNTKVKISEDWSLPLPDFLSCFDSSVTQKKEPDEQVPISISLPEEKLLKLGKFFFRLMIQGKIPIKELQMVLIQNSLVPEQLMNLVLTNWLSSDMSGFQENNIILLHSIIKFLSGLPEVKELVSVEGGEMSLWWNNVRYMLSRASNHCAALVGAVVCRNIADIMVNSQSKRGTPQSEVINGQEWVQVSLEMEQWNRLVRQLEDLLIVGMLIYSKPISPNWRLTAAVGEIEVNVDKLLACGKGGVSELIAKWTVKHGVLPSLLSDALKDKGPKHISELDLERKDEIIPSLIQIIQARFPDSLTHDILMANCTWEYAVEWNKDIGIIDHIESAVLYLIKIMNAVFKHWIACMLWEMFVSKVLKSSALLFDKVGKAPKDRLCRKSIGMSDLTLEKFIALSRNLLEIIIQASEEADEVPIFDIEDLWHVSGKPPPSSQFLDLASTCKVTNYGLLQHHMQLLTCMNAILNFGMKVKIFSLFDSKGKDASFKPLTSYPLLPSYDLDTNIDKARMQFLSKLILCAVQRFPVPLTEDNTNIIINSHWSETALQLGRDWTINVDELKRQYVYELYVSGYDQMAEEVLHTVQDYAVMGSQLILLVGQRLSRFVFSQHQDKVSEKLAYLTPTLTTWLKSLDTSTLRNSDTPLRACKTIMGHVVNYLPQKHSEQGMANDLVDAISSLLEWEEYQNKETVLEILKPEEKEKLPVIEKDMHTLSRRDTSSPMGKEKHFTVEKDRLTVVDKERPSVVGKDRLSASHKERGISMDKERLPPLDREKVATIDNQKISADIQVTQSQIEHLIDSKEHLIKAETGFLDLHQFTIGPDDALGNSILLQSQSIKSKEAENVPVRRGFVVSAVKTTELNRNNSVSIAGEPEAESSKKKVDNLLPNVEKKD